MKKETESELDSLLNEDSRRVAEIKIRSDKTQAEAEALSRRWNKIGAEIIRPVMQEIGTKLKLHGHNYDTEIDVGSITMRVDFAGRRAYKHSHSNDYAPRISFFQGGDEVLIKARSDQTLGSSPFDNYTYKLDELTKDIVEEKVLEFIRKSLSATT
jgi:hypothetical protein